MKAGLIADIVVAVFIIVVVAICTKRGFLRTLLYCTSTILALAIAIFAAAPLANFLDQKFGWQAVIANWHIPFVKSETILYLGTGIALFVVARLVFIILDKIFKAIKEKMGAINAIDRVLGMVLGVILAAAGLCCIFMLIDALNLANVLQLNEGSGSYLAEYLFAFCKKYLFEMMQTILSAASSYLPKV